MSVPTHNLYDFVHQATKRKFFLMYFYPWGSRGIENICHYQTSKDFFDGPNGIATQDRVVLPSLLSKDMNHRLASQVHPVILCHDQEPLNFDLYLPDSDLMNHYSNLYNQQRELYLAERIKNLNLRACNPAALQEKWILLHSELNSPQLTHYENTGAFIGAYWWSHAIIARDWYRFAEYDKTLQNNTNYSKLFLTYCRGTTGSRQYRKDFLQQLDQFKLTDQCVFQSLHNRSCGSESSAVYESDDINATAISVVLETVFDQRIHLTEKILRPIACGHPFILAAGSGSLSLLKKYGFKTFSPYIDETYDSIIDDQSRLSAVVAAMTKFKNLEPQYQTYALESCREIAKFNQNHFFSNDFFKNVVDELSTNVEQAHQSHTNLLDFETWWKERKWQRSVNPKGVRVFDAESKFNSELVRSYRCLRRSV
jgi:hypothetical protein